jgi:hypothetical protein
MSCMAKVFSYCLVCFISLIVYTFNQYLDQDEAEIIAQ